MSHASPPRRLQPGSRVQLSGGYDSVPEWLGDVSSYSGTVERFIPGQTSATAAVVRLDTPIRAGGMIGSIVVLELRYVGQHWWHEGMVHLELCDFEPEPLPWRQRRQGLWIESHGFYELAQDGGHDRGD